MAARLVHAKRGEGLGAGEWAAPAAYWRCCRHHPVASAEREMMPPLPPPLPCPTSPLAAGGARSRMPGRVQVGREGGKGRDKEGKAGPVVSSNKIQIYSHIIHKISTDTHITSTQANSMSYIQEHPPIPKPHTSSASAPALPLFSSTAAGAAPSSTSLAPSLRASRSSFALAAARDSRGTPP